MHLWIDNVDHPLPNRPDDHHAMFAGEGKNEALEPLPVDLQCQITPEKRDYRDTREVFQLFGHLEGSHDQTGQDDHECNRVHKHPGATTADGGMARYGVKRQSTLYL